MPLPGGPSDKIGNRYEVRWVVRQVAGLLTGRLDWLRLEPPGEDAIELRCGVGRKEWAHQVKRGVSGGGHWTIAALADVLADFSNLLADRPKLQCLFVSSHAAPGLQELGERALSARDLKEFKKRFLTAKWLMDAWSELRDAWRSDEAIAWSRLRRITAVAIGEPELRDGTDELLRLLLDGPPETARAVLVELVLESVHQELRAADVLAHLERHSIRRVNASAASAIAPQLLPPPAVGIRRDAELHQIASLIASGHSTIVVGGISGIGKSTVVAQLAAAWPSAVCWLDAALVATPLGALAAVAEFAADRLGDHSVAKAIPTAGTKVAAVARLAGSVLGAKHCLLVWDGVDGDLHKELRPVIDAVAVTVGTGGAQLVTTQETRPSGKVPQIGSLRVERLPRTAIAQLLTGACADARTEDVDAADSLTHGHPFLVQLLVELAESLSLHDALEMLRADARAAPLVSAVMATLSDEDRRILSTLAWLDVPFDARHLRRLDSSPSVLERLATRHLVIRSGHAAYRVHDLVSHLIKSAAVERERVEAHERAALLLRTLEAASWLEIRALLRHARAASLKGLMRDAGATLLKFAMERGHWELAREAAEGLAVDSNDFYVHFVLGKSYRMTRDLAKALSHLEIAVEHAPDARERSIARFDRASVLCELGRRPEADIIFTAELESPSAEMRAAARLGLALGASDRGERDTALHMLDEALLIAEASQATRQIAEVRHAMARIFIDSKEWDTARKHLKLAHTIRIGITDGAQAFDVLGSFHLFASILEVERALGDRTGASEAAHGMWRFSVAAGSPAWETRAAEAMFRADPNDQDPEVMQALVRLRAWASDNSLSDNQRVVVLVTLTVCEWMVRHYESATEHLLETLALANERNIGVPAFTWAPPRSPDPPELVVPYPEEPVLPLPQAYLLFTPRDSTPEFAYALVSRVLERRPELTQHANLIFAKKPSGKTNNSSGATDRKAKAKQKPKKRGSRR